MNPEVGSTRSVNTRKTMKTNILSDSELLDLLENDMLSSDEDFGFDSDDDIFDAEFNDSDSETGNLSDNDNNNLDRNSFDNNSLSYNVNEYNWFTDPPVVENIPFMSTANLKCIPEGNQPIDYFNFLFSDELLDHLVKEANAYAVDIFLTTASVNARICHWTDTNRSEIKIFFSLLFHMGTIKLSRIEDYWKTSVLFNIPFFREHMSRNRFMLLLRALHFSRNTQEGELAPRNRLYKIQPIVDYFNSKMNEIYEPSKNLSIDESMVLWRGRLIFRQYIKNKRHKYGVKMYMLTEPWELIHRIMVYSGQGQDVSEDSTHTEFVVEKLMDGTLRSNRKNNPKDVIEKKLKKGESICRYTNDGICVAKWRDKRDVLMISSEFPHEMNEITTKKKEVKIKPISVKKYNENMSGVDRQDQMSAYYPFERKTLRWLSVIQGLLPKQQNIQINTKKRNSETHLPKKVPKNNKKRYMYKRCKYCYAQGIRKDTIYFCNECQDQPGLCLDSCFVDFHKSI
ncbi:hypothetical protein QTP88_019089 [Uroleucon formosanum]